MANVLVHALNGATSLSDTNVFAAKEPTKPNSMFAKGAMGLRAVLVSLVAILPPSTVTHAASLPPPTGPYYVGVRKYTIEHYNARDPLAPNNVSTEFLATVFYPTRQKPQGAPRPYLNPETAALFEQSWNYSAGTLAGLTSTVQPDAPFLDVGTAPPHPTLLFGPGAGGPPTEGDTVLIAELASHGYAVFALDHPYEQPFVRFPNGTVVTGVPIDYTSLALIRAIYDTRLVDNAALLDQLPALAARHRLPFRTARLGALGYSLAGAAAIGTLQREQEARGAAGARVAAALDLDGTLFGGPAEDGPAADARAPTFLLGNEAHGAPFGGDVSWLTFPPRQSAPTRRLLITGSRHRDFCDASFWKTLQPGADPAAGPVDGARQTLILNTYVRAFFDAALRGRDEPLLDTPSPDFPEVVYDYVSPL
ncbi:hypothetical protein GGS23DRAFT_597982 [Durotheca rogersii]|uniref:uncharacterized protein n=1 Tax=Durotheca rogersii TaxID=419775 RepID=UPI0022205DA1|nr:uncharacterized protein GGS23DRAFT_597982 [Durotheca rogersii]KAI5861964.1 hypothetical protein GGS23DRAFT_597982 [Durotheca rogersii]